MFIVNKLIKDIIMKKIVYSLMINIAVFFCSSNVYAEWRLSNSTDELYRKEITTAYATSKIKYDTLFVYVRCSGDDFDVIIDYDTYLGSDRLDIMYRFDNSNLVTDITYPSTTGTSIFISDESNFARELMRSNTVIIGVKDYRGTRHNVKFNLSGSYNKIKKVMNACDIPLERIPERNDTEASGSSISELNDKISSHVSNSIERWGPNHVRLSKELLHVQGYYSEEINLDKNLDFYLAVQKYYDDQIERCKSPTFDALFCPIDGVKSTKHPVSSVLYITATKDIKEKLGPLKINE